ncbi:unnamed protein product [Rotaria magnacalcarata]|uniref:Uncharacterized protein n=2 Tax=Rotaria magnacalcarata TaxID=392030 RepID=A0A814R120_9BILA|nr:unnamed protein product [Rotaria magnacalcarata]CAF1647225.1 unnamed protein product [Rotaria magnacalcarata]CAF2034600.1 unnamed protein product [Rotaria magnacalcarata]CAF2127644.1 unnamed protein product [Rotaria magnacalcarata]CAF3871340.1 unnamed protein product [Rotaria magnacalcarata]
MVSRQEKGFIMNGNRTASSLEMIENLARANNDTIAQLNTNYYSMAQPNVNSRSTMNLVTYHITHSNGALSVQEQNTHKHCNQFLNDWRGKIDIYEISDVFNDKINYSCTNYQDLQRLNKDMLLAVRKYELFGDSDSAQRELSKFKQNFMQIQAALRQLSELITTGGSGHLTSIREQLDNINNQLKLLRNQYRNIAFN